MRAQFILSEISIGLRRNVTMTIAVIVTVMITLFLAGTGLLVHKQVDVMKGYWYDKIEVTVYLCGVNSVSQNCAGKDITPEQREQLNLDLHSTAEVQKVYYESKQDAYNRFKQEFKESKELVDTVSPDALPESYRVKLKDPKQFEVLATKFQDKPGVDTVQDLKKLLDPVFKLLNVLQGVAWFVAGIMLLSAMILISNTIRLAAFSRRRETGIMRLVGASNFYIQVPFLLEGAIAGLLGAVGACGILALGYQLVIVDRVRPLVRFTNFIGWGAVYSTIPYVLIAGVIMAGLASFFTLRRHLRV